MSILAKIAEIEAEMARTQKNKATMGHLGMLKARIAKLRQQLIAPKGGPESSGEGFDVAKTGDARIGFVGLPSCAFVDNEPARPCERNSTPDLIKSFQR